MNNACARLVCLTDVRGDRLAAGNVYGRPLRRVVGQFIVIIIEQFCVAAAAVAG